MNLSHAERLEQIDRLERRIKWRYHRIRLIVLLVILPLIAFAISYGIGVKWVNDTRVVGDIKRVVSHDLVWPWQDRVEVNLIPPNITVSPSGVPRANALFVIDESGSMGSKDREGDSMYQAIAASRALASLLLSSGASVGLMTFNENSTLHAAPTLDVDVLDAAWLDIGRGGGTDIAEALDSGISHLLSAPVQTQSDGTQKRVLILISDGEDSVDRVKRLADKARVNDIVLVGVSIGASYNSRFFTEAFNNPDCKGSYTADDARKCLHAYIPWQTELTGMTGTLRQLLLDRELLQSLGNNVHLEEYPYSPKFIVRVKDSTNSLLSRVQLGANGKLDFRMPYLLNMETNFKYHLEPNSWGILPIADRKATLIYTDDNGSQVVYETGEPPVILVIPLWLLLLIIAPLVLFSVQCLTTKMPKFKLKDPRFMPPLLASIDAPTPAVKNFARGSEEPLSDEGESGMIPTAIIAIGPKGGEMLAATVSHRIQTGLAAESDYFKSFYLDCRDLTEEQLPKHFDVSIARKHHYRYAKQNQLFELAKAIKGKPYEYKGLDAWLDIDRFLQSSLDLNLGCGGDRQFARLAALYDLTCSDSTIVNMCEQIKQWAAQKPQTQVHILIGAGEDQGSGIVVDVATELQRKLVGIATHVSLMFDMDTSDAFSTYENQQALMIELRALQAANGMPFYGFRQPEQQEEPIVLPLFDRIIQFNELAKGKDDCGAFVLQSLETRFRQTIEQRLANISWKTRSGRSAVNGVMNRHFSDLIAVSQLRVPVYHRRQIWALQALIETLSDWFIKSSNQTVEEDSCANLAASMHLVTSKNWPWIFRSISDEAKEKLNWANLFAQQLTNHSIVQYKRDLQVITCGYLNGTQEMVGGRREEPLKRLRLGRFARLVSEIEKANKQLNLVATDLRRGESKQRLEFIEQLIAVLAAARAEILQWNNLINGESQGEQTSLIGTWESRKQVLIDSSLNDCYGQKEDPWQDHLSAYQNSNLAKEIQADSLNERIWWQASPNGAGIELLFNGNEQVILDKQTILDGQFETVVRQLLLVENREEMSTGGLDAWFADSSDINKALSARKPAGEGELIFAHGYNSETTIDSFEYQTNKVDADAEFVHHRFTDRIIIANYNAHSNGEYPYEWEERSSKLPFVNVGCAIIRQIYAEAARNGRGQSGTTATALARMMAQRPQLFRDALTVQVNRSMIKTDEPFVSLQRWLIQLSPQDIRYLTIPGQVNEELALQKLLLEKQDVQGEHITLKLPKLDETCLQDLNDWIAQQLQDHSGTSSYDWKQLMVMIAQSISIRLEQG